MPGEIRIGCSGWSYPHWRNVFYPAKLPAGDHFAFYARHFNAVELNNSFYRQPPRERFEAWREQALDLVVDAALGLGDKLGPILFQLQANFHLDLERLKHFVGMLPKDVRESFEITSDFTYIRMHLPPEGLGYGQRALQPWAHRIIDWCRGGLDTFVYFNNDMEGRAIKDAQTLISLVALK